MVSPSSLNICSDELALLLSRIKRYILGAPLIAMGHALDKKAPLTETCAIEVRMGEFVYFVPGDGRVTVIFDVSFKDPTDLAIARVFMLVSYSTATQNKPN